MSIWTSKARVFACLTTLLLVGCDQIPGASGGAAAPLTQASLADGAVQLATPQGYCIDRRSLRARFALLGRCDTLGAEGYYAAWELAIVTVSLAQVDPGAAAASLPVSPGPGRILAQIDRADLTLTQIQSTTPELDGVSDHHWRTTFVLNDELISLALYAPESSRATGEEGARILSDIARIIRAATPQNSE